MKTSMSEFVLLTDRQSFSVLAGGAAAPLASVTAKRLLRIVPAPTQQADGYIKATQGQRHRSIATRSQKEVRMARRMVRTRAWA